MSRLGQISLFVGAFFLFLWFVAMRALSNNPMPFIWVLLGLGLACVLGAVFKDFKYYVELFAQRATKQGMSLGALILIVLGILVITNYLGFRHNKKFDFTKDSRYALSPQTKDLLRGLSDDLNVVGFFAENRPDAARDKVRLQDLMAFAQSETSKLKVRYVDTVKRPDEAKAYEVSTASVAILEYKGKKTKIEDFGEQSFANAVIKVKSNDQKTIYYMTGHGELNMEGNDVAGAGNLKKYITDSSYVLKRINFLEKAEIPSDCSVLLILGPKVSYGEKEVELLRRYLLAGGRLLLALDPENKSGLNTFVSQYGLEFKNNFILDLNGEKIGQGPATAVGVVFSPTHEITKSFRAGEGVGVFFMASQIKPREERSPALAIDEIVRSNEASFTKAQLKVGEARPIDGKDDRGPITIAAVSSGKLTDEKTKKVSEKEFQLVLFGDSEFLNNKMIDASLNRDLILNSISFLARDLDQISIRPKSPEATELMMTNIQKVLFFYSMVLGLPILIFITGGIVWFRRRSA